LSQGFVTQAMQKFDAANHKIRLAADRNGGPPALPAVLISPGIEICS
jgi:hypothetical protein